MASECSSGAWMGAWAPSALSLSPALRLLICWLALRIRIIIIGDGLCIALNPKPEALNCVYRDHTVKGCRYETEDHIMVLILVHCIMLTLNPKPLNPKP